MDSLNTEHKEAEFYHEKDIFVLNLNEDNYVQSVSNTPEIEESCTTYCGWEIKLLNSRKGETNHYAATYDSVISKVDTIIHYRYFYRVEKVATYSLPVLSQSATPDGIIYQMGFDDGSFKFFKKEQGESQLNLVIDGEQVEVELQQGIASGVIQGF